MRTTRPITLCVSALLAALAGCRPAVSQENPAARSAATDSGGTGSTKAVQSMAPKYSKSRYDATPLTRERVAELAARLAPEAFQVTQRADTEPPFCGTLLDNKKDGTYCCVVCGLPLFSSTHKFDSGTGWPSFFREFDPEHVARRPDRSHGMIRTEIACARCNAHLGHVFDDGPPPTNERHCLNSAALRFFEQGAPLPAESQPVQAEVAYVAGGCFWGIEHYFQQGPGVLDASSGYMQGRVENPSYRQVCTGTTGHAETVKVEFDPQRVSFRRLLEAFFAMHDPTQLDRQGPDVGPQYRSGIWYTSAQQKEVAEALISELTARRDFGERAIVTQLEPARTFWPAEDYHQDYILKTGGACQVRNPW